MIIFQISTNAGKIQVDAGMASVVTLPGVTFVTVIMVTNVLRMAKVVKV